MWHRYFLALALLLWSANMAATPTLAHSLGTSCQSGGDGKVWTINVQPSLQGNCLVLKAEVQDGGGDPTVTDNKGNTWSLATSVFGNQRLSGFIAPNATAGVTKLTVTYAVATNRAHFDYSEWPNVLQDTAANVLNGVSGATGVNPLQPGTITTTADGCLILHWGSNNGNVDNKTVFTKGSGFTLLRTHGSGLDDGLGFNNIQTCVSQYQVQGTHGAINPSYTYSGAANFGDTIAIALKPSASAAGTQPPAGIWVRGIQHFYFPQGSVTRVFQFPHLGNLIHVSAQSENPLTGITDGDGNTYQTSAGERETQTSVAGIESWRALNVAPNTDLRTISVTSSGALNLNEGMMHFYDIQVADTVQGSGGKVQTVIANGQQLAVTDLQTVTITPINQNALIIFSAPVEAHTLNALTIPTGANGGNFDGQTSDTQDGSGGLTNDDGWGHWYNGSSLSATTITYGIQPGGVAVNNWAALATEYKASSGVAGPLPGRSAAGPARRYVGWT